MNKVESWLNRCIDFILRVRSRTYPRADICEDSEGCSCHDEDRHAQIAFGVQYKGPFTTRPSDVLGLALGTTHVNSRVAAGERLLSEVNGSNVPVQSSEYVAEVFYGWTPWPFVTLRPNLQYVVHPGGSNIYANGVVVGLKTTVKF